MNCAEKAREARDAKENQQTSLAEVADATSIDYYMKEHPGFFATAISVIVAVITFVLNAAEHHI